MFKQYQDVVLIRDSLTDTFFGKPISLRQGQQGIIMEIFNRPGVPTGYDVEFFDDNGDTIAVTIVKEDDIAPLSAKTPKSQTGKQSDSQVA